MNTINMNTYLRSFVRYAPVFLVCFLAILPDLAHAAACATLPWDGPLQKIQGSLTGPIAKALGVIALAVTGGMLAFGGELSEFAKRICMVVLALAVLLLANTFITSLSLTGGGC